MRVPSPAASTTAVIGRYGLIRRAVPTDAEGRRDVGGDAAVGGWDRRRPGVVEDRAGGAAAGEDRGRARRAFEPGAEADEPGLDPFGGRFEVVRERADAGRTRNF